MGLFGRKKDFWDEVDNDARIPDIPDSELTQEDEQRIQQQLAAIDEEGWHPTRSRVIKLLARLILMVAAIAILFSGYIIYRYVRSGGSWTSAPDYYQSSEFLTEYDRSVGQLLQLVEAIDSQTGTTQADSEANQQLINEYLSADGNFAFVVYDGSDNEVVSSGEDAVSRIEGSRYFLRISSVDGYFSVDTSLSQSELDTGAWENSLMNCSETYTIYTAVDNELTAVNDGFYQSYEDFQSLSSDFGLARIIGIAGIVVFIILLIFCVIAAGSVKGYDGVKLCWVDKIFTELIIIIAVALTVGCYFLYTYCSDQSGLIGDYGPIVSIALAYIFVIECYFSLVRRIKAGTFVTGMLVYDEDKIGRIMRGKRIRMDFATILPELVSNNFRGCTRTCFDKDKQFFSNVVRHTTNTEIVYGHVLSSSPWGDSWGDIIRVFGLYDLTLRLPPVPKDGTYELRIGNCHMDIRGMAQLYFGDDPDRLMPAGLPYDMRQTPGPNTPDLPWKADTDDWTENYENDKALRNQGYMKGPHYFTECNGQGNSTLRNRGGAYATFRRIVTTADLRADKTYYLRIKSALKKYDAELVLDYFEFAPSYVYNGATREDIW